MVNGGSYPSTRRAFSTEKSRLSPRNLYRALLTSGGVTDFSRLARRSRSTARVHASQSGIFRRGGFRPASRATVPQVFASAEAFADFFLTWYGPTRAAAGRLEDAGRQALRDDMVALAADSNRGTDGSFVSDWEYLLVTAVRR